MTLTGLALATGYALSPTLPGHESLWGIAAYVFSDAGLVLPFATFAGGLACGGGASVGPASATRRMLWPAFVFAIVAYAFVGYLAPLSEYRVDVAAGNDIRVEYPHGPYTLFGLSQLRDSVEADPPTEYSYRVDQPLRHPPNWLTHQIHQSLTLALFAVPNATLGLLIGILTSGLPPPKRRRRRWAAGLVCGLTFFGAVVAADAWFLQDPERSGVISGWLPLSVPLLWLVLVGPIVVRRANGLHSSDSSSV